MGKILKIQEIDDFFNEFDRMNWFQRLFSWGKMTKLAREAYGSIKSTIESGDSSIEIKTKLEASEKEIKRLESEISEKKELIASITSEKKVLDQELKTKEKELSRLTESKENNTKELAKLNSDLENLNKTKKDLDSELVKKEKEISKLGESSEKQISQISELKSKIELLEERNKDYINDKKDLEKKNTSIEKELDQKRKEYDTQVIKSLELQDRLKEEMERLNDQRVAEEKKKFEEMKKTWANHEITVENEIKLLCERNVLEYISKSDFPTKKKPDNAIKILDELVIFDAKSPASDDLKNFPEYIKRQTKDIEKYMTRKEVKRDVFLVVPTNTLDVLPERYFDMGEYRVYVITKEAVEPIIKSFKKIEEYDNVQEFTPEDREQICQVIGRFAHATKRRVQIDGFFMKEFVDIWKRLGDLPEEVVNSVETFEKSGNLLNPPTEQRKKKISVTALDKERRNTEKELEIVGVNPKVEKKDIDTIELYDKKKE